MTDVITHAADLDPLMHDYMQVVADELEASGCTDPVVTALAADSYSIAIAGIANDSRPREVHSRTLTTAFFLLWAHITRAQEVAQ